jgi:hypothetical protein
MSAGPVRRTGERFSYYTVSLFLDMEKKQVIRNWGALAWLMEVLGCIPRNKKIIIIISNQMGTLSKSVGQDQVLSSFQV